VKRATVIRDFVVGLTGIVGLAGLAFMLLMFGEFTASARQRYDLFLQMPQTAGIVPSSPITLNGVRIGIVKEARTAPDPRDGVILTLKIDEGVRIPRAVDVSVERSFVGDTSLALITIPAAPGTAVSEADFLQPGDTWQSETGGFLDEIGALLNERLVGLDQAAASFERLAETYMAVGERAADFFEPRTAAEVDAGEPPNLASTLDRLDSAIAGAERWLNDEQLRQDVALFARKTGELAERLGEPGGAVESWTKAADSISRNADRLGDRAAEAASHLAETTRAMNEAIAEVQILTARINSGEGTLGQLIQNPDLYRSLLDASIRLERALTEAQLLLEKYRKEGIPIRF